MGFPRQEYWSRVPFLSPRDPPDPGIQPVSPALAGRFLTSEPPGKPSLNAHLNDLGPVSCSSSSLPPQGTQLGELLSLMSSWSQHPLFTYVAVIHDTEILKVSQNIF